MAKSKVMQANKKRKSAAVAKLSPAEKLRIACELSDLCRDLGKAGEKALAKRLRVDKRLVKVKRGDSIPVRNL